MKKLSLLFSILALICISFFWSCQKSTEVQIAQEEETTITTYDGKPPSDFGNDYIVAEVDTDCGHFEIHVVCDFTNPGDLRVMVVAPNGSNPVHFSFFGNGNTIPFASSTGFNTMREGEIVGGGSKDLDEITVTIECEGSQPESFTYKNPCK